eukprot:UN09405
MFDFLVPNMTHDEELPKHVLLYQKLKKKYLGYLFFFTKTFS